MPQPSTHTPLGLPFVELPFTDSTNNYARALIKEGKGQHGIAVFTNDQQAGKGQRGKTWIAEKGKNMALSLVIKPNFLTISQQFQLSALAAIASLELISEITNGNCAIKWPNDLYWQDRKAGGILIESIVSASGNWDWAIIGIGINVNQEKFPEDLPNPVSLKQITGKDQEPKELALLLCKKLDYYFQQLEKKGFHALYQTYLNQLYQKDQVVRFKKGAAAFNATIETVTPTGELVINHAIKETIPFGQIEWVIN